jgi:glutathione peroxidase
MRTVKKISLALFMLIIVLAAYVEIVNIHSKNMTYRQKLLKAFYPAIMWWSKLSNKNRTTLSGDQMPPVSFYSLTAQLNSGDTVSFSSFTGKKVLLVNTASDCGYTGQYKALEKLYEDQREQLVILGFPANDFKQEEKGSDEQIAAFCKKNYGVSFLLMKKSVVRKGATQNEPFQWLSDSTKNGWCNKQPAWNFCKYLVNEKGVLTNYFGSAISPLDKSVLDAINKK